MSTNLMQKAREALANHPRCHAKSKRSGQRCRNPAMPNGVCRMHGGNAGRPPTHGNCTNEVRKLNREIKELLKSIYLLVD